MFTSRERLLGFFSWTFLKSDCGESSCGGLWKKKCRFKAALYCFVLGGGLDQRVSSSADTLLIPEVKREWSHNFEMTGR